MAMLGTAPSLRQWKPRELLAGAVIARVLDRQSSRAVTDRPPPPLMEAWRTEVAEVTGPAAGRPNDDTLRRRLESVLDRLTRSPTGRDLVEAAHRENIDIRVDSLLNASGFYAREHRVAVLDLERLSDAQASLTMSHTFSHVRQASGGAAVDLRRYAAGDNALLNRTLQADAVAETCQVAWELKDCADAAVWEEARRHPAMGGAAAAFSAAVAADSRAAADGRARRAAYDGWFRLSGVVRAGDEAVARLHEGAPAPAAPRAVDAALLVPLGLRPDGTDQFAVPGSPLPDDALYRQFDAGVADRLGRLVPTQPPVRGQAEGHRFAPVRTPPARDARPAAPGAAVPEETRHERQGKL
jgi:hypothetical protein